MCKTTTKILKNKTFEEERSLYRVNNYTIDSCLFEGKVDGESPLKEVNYINVINSNFSLRYAIWNANYVNVNNTIFTDKCRAPFWYNYDFNITNSQILGIKAFRECNRVNVKDCTFNSPETFWKCKNVTISNVKMNSEYPFFECENLVISNLNMTAKYSFQYCKNIVIKNSYLNTKDAFWHSKHITIIDSIIEGEYLAWYSKDIKFINCKIIGTQPFWKIKKLKINNSTMTNCDLSFELSTVKASINGSIDSIKSPRKAKITCDSIKDIIIDKTLVNPKKAKIIYRNK